MSIRHGIDCALVAIVAALPSHALAASNLNSSRSNTPLSATYDDQKCLADGGKVDKTGDSAMCVFATDSEKTVVKSKSNITNN